MNVAMSVCDMVCSLRVVDVRVVEPSMHSLVSSVVLYTGSETLRLIPSKTTASAPTSRARCSIAA